MKIVLLSVFSFLFASSAIAGNMNCGGKILHVMGGHYSCGGFVAFKTESSNMWMCSQSKDADSVILAGFMADKSTYTAIIGTDTANSECSELPHYRKISYVILNK